LKSDIIKKAQPSRENVWQMFDRIAARYDLLNHLLSAGQDIRWRAKVKKYLPARNDLELLDIATGTGDQLLSLLGDKRVSAAVGVDLAMEMIRIGRKKAENRQLSDVVEFRNGDACDLDFPDNRFDVVTISFGIRNVLDLDKAISEMYRVLNDQGRLIILEFSLPRRRVLRSMYLWYFRKILPSIGSAISGDGYAYRYLNQTVETFPFGQEFCNFLLRAGFNNAQAIPLTLGVATIYVADKSM
jgi:demethylmenaquinone methyltransferase/2-methoxy-6-polyprenyl-1,4-benzoquinol methylase